MASTTIIANRVAVSGVPNSAEKNAAMPHTVCLLYTSARKFFVSSRIYRIGGDEFVILTPKQPPYSCLLYTSRCV